MRLDQQLLLTTQPSVWVLLKIISFWETGTLQFGTKEIQICRKPSGGVGSLVRAHFWARPQGNLPDDACITYRRASVSINWFWDDSGCRKLSLKERRNTERKSAEYNYGSYRNLNAQTSAESNAKQCEEKSTTLKEPVSCLPVSFCLLIIRI
jgi:hypothetical protein